MSFYEFEEFSFSSFINKDLLVDIKDLFISLEE
jgi:hypothetical protein